jgi:hypothetical protein
MSYKDDKARFAAEFAAVKKEEKAAREADSEQRWRNAARRWEEVAG